MDGQSPDVPRKLGNRAGTMIRTCVFSAIKQFTSTAPDTATYMYSNSEYSFLPLNTMDQYACTGWAWFDFDQTRKTEVKSLDKI